MCVDDFLHFWTGKSTENGRCYLDWGSLTLASALKPENGFT